VIILSAAPAFAADQPRQVPIELSSFCFTPDTILLEQGEPYLLHLRNSSGGRHDFIAKEFFSAPVVAADDRPQVAGRKISLHGGEEARLALPAPVRGRREVHCSHFMHSGFGMEGSIVVE
jgi:uncharacterized cupredoxin-like copper-binding protein